MPGFDHDSILCTCGHRSAAHATGEPLFDGGNDIGTGACGASWPKGMRDVSPSQWSGSAFRALGEESCGCRALNPVDMNDAWAKSWPSQGRLALADRRRDEWRVQNPFRSAA